MEGNTLQGYIASDARVERLRRTKRWQLCAAEQQREAEWEAAQVQAATKQRSAAREAALAEALATHKAEELRKEKVLQRIREEAPELRELKAKLEAQTLNHVRQKQLAEAAERQRQVRELERKAEEEMEQARQGQVRREEERAAKRRAELRQQKVVLEGQMRAHEEQKVEEYRNFVREKRDVDDIVRRIQQEERQEIDEKRTKLQRTKEGFEMYLHERERLKQIQRDEAEDEDRRIVEFMQLQSQRQADESAKKRAKQAEAERILQHQSHQIAEERREKEEMEKLMLEYDIEVREDRARQDDARRHAKIVTEREAMNSANRYQQRLKAAKAEAERQEEAQFRNAMQAKFAEDEVRERELAVVRAQRRQETYTEVSALLEQKQQLREAEKERERLHWEQEQQFERERQRVVEQAKAQMLAEHAARLKALTMP